MTNERRKLSRAEELRLCNQVNGHCPLSGKKLYARKNGRDYKRFEIAHIYPLNPTAEEELLLKNEVRLHANSDDPNDLDNLIPLEAGTHAAFDTPRTLDEYRNLVAIKKAILDDEEDRSMMSSSELEQDIVLVINALHNGDFVNDITLNYEPKKIDEKVDSTLTAMTTRRIRADVSEYYVFIQKRFKELEYAHPTASELIATQVKAYYLKQKAKHISQEKIFVNIVAWITAKAHPDTRSSAEVVASYFVQNCEIFE